MSESDSDARTPGLILVAWVGVSIGIMALGGWVETALWVDVGKAIRVIGSLVLFPSIFVLDAFTSALPQTLRHRFYIGLAVVGIGLMALLYRYSPESRGILLGMVVVFGGSVAVIAVGALAQNWLDSRRSGY